MSFSLRADKFPNQIRYSVLSSSLANSNQINAAKLTFEAASTQGVDKQTLGQILVLEKDEKSSILGRYFTTLVTQRMDKFNAYQLKSNDLGQTTIADRLPALGAIPDENFVAHEQVDRYASVRVLLQTRLISQLIARSWLPDSNEETLAIRYLFLTVGQEADTYIGPDINDHPELTLSDCVENLIKIREREIIALHRKCQKGESDKIFNGNNILVPGFMNWSSLRLSLLMAGQAYLKENDTYIPLSESIFGAYEIAQLYSFKVSWSTFVGTIDEFASPYTSQYQYPPAQEITVPYPPRPDLKGGFNLSEQQLEEWASAKLGKPGTDESPWPFYPGPSDDDDTVKFHVPPFPYLPLSSC